MFWKIILSVFTLLFIGLFIVVRSYYLAFKPAFGGYFIKKDKVVYYSGMQGLGINRSWTVEGVDLKSFKKLGDRYAKDNNRAYLNGKPIRFSHGPSFKRINKVYAKDQDRVYYAGETLSFDVQGFKVTGTQAGNFLVEDQKRKYRNDQIIAHQDEDRFRALQSGYSIEKGIVFYNAKLVRGVELSSFRVIPEADEKYALDIDKVYYKGKTIK